MLPIDLPEGGTDGQEPGSSPALDARHGGAPAFGIATPPRGPHAAAADWPSEAMHRTTRQGLAMGERFVPAAVRLPIDGREHRVYIVWDRSTCKVVAQPRLWRWAVAEARQRNRA